MKNSSSSSGMTDTYLQILTEHCVLYSRVKTCMCLTLSALVPDSQNGSKSYTIFWFVRAFGLTASLPKSQAGFVNCLGTMETTMAMKQSAFGLFLQWYMFFAAHVLY